MAKIFDSSEDIVEMIENKFDEVGLANYGLNIKVMSVTKSKDIIKAAKASATVEHLTHKNDLVTVTVYEEAFDRLPDDVKGMFVDMAMSNVSYDFEKDKLNVDTAPFNQIFRMRQKYGDTEFLNALELGNSIIEQIEEEAKAKKEAEREAKKAAKSHNG